VSSTLKQALADGERVYGTMLALVRSPRWARVLAGSGLDYVVIDTEHSAYGRDEVADLIDTLDQAGITPIVRVPTPDPSWVRMAMDAGAHGVLAPYCETVDQVERVVAAAKSRPLKGALLDRLLSTGEPPSDQLIDYLGEANDTSFVIIAVESMPAVENLDGILQVKGIDAIFVGPHDLSCSLGMPEQYEHSDFEATVARILAKCTASGVPMTVHFPDLRLSRKWVEAGVQLVLHSSDVALLGAAVKHDLRTLRGT